MTMPDPDWIKRAAGELRAAETAEARQDVLARNDLNEDQGRRLDALNLVEAIGHAEQEGAGAITGWYESRDEVVALTAEVALVASRFVREVGKRTPTEDPGTGGYL